MLKQLKLMEDKILKTYTDKMDWFREKHNKNYEESSNDKIYSVVNNGMIFTTTNKGLYEYVFDTEIKRAKANGADAPQVKVSEGTENLPDDTILTSTKDIYSLTLETPLDYRYGIPDIVDHSMIATDDLRKMQYYAQFMSVAHAKKVDHYDSNRHNFTTLATLSFDPAEDKDGKFNIEQVFTVNIDAATTADYICKFSKVLNDKVKNIAISDAEMGD